MLSVSVIIATYNYALFISRAIDSILNQTVSDVEIIIVDDGSTDNTRQIVESFHDKRICYFKQENRGAPSARNFGLHQAEGNYLLFLDADDWLMPEALASRLKYLNSHLECGWVYGPAIYRLMSGEDVTEHLLQNRLAQNKKRQGDVLPNLLLGELIPICSVLARTELIREVGGFNVHLPCLQDYELWLRVSAAAQVGFIEDCNVVVQVHEGSISQSRADGYNTLLKILLDAESRYLDTVQTLGFDWRKRLSTVMGERGRHLFLEGRPTAAKKLLLRAIRKDPLNFKHYTGLSKGLLELIST